MEETEMAMTKETATRKRNPQDVTLRNVRAAHTRIDELERRLDKLAKKVKKLKHG
jgi:tetrahydromethanopterin S-methyltransferase subunit B